MKAPRMLAGAAMLCAQLIATSAHAVPACMTKADFAAILAKELPAARVVVFEAREAGLFLASIARSTNTPPVQADALMIVDLSPGMPVVKVVVFRNGCAAQIGTIDRRIVTRAVNDVTRDGA